MGEILISWWLLPIIPAISLAMLDSSKLFRLVVQSPLQFDEGDPRATQSESMLGDYASRIEEYIQQNPTNVFISQYLKRARTVGLQ